MQRQHRRTHQFILALFSSLLLLICSAGSSFANDLPTIIIDENHPNLIGTKVILENEINANIIVMPSYTLVVRQSNNLVINGNLSIEDGATVTGGTASHLTVKENLSIGRVSISVEKVTVEGDCTLEGSLSTAAIKTFTIKGNFIHLSGALTLGPTTLTVLGDFRAQRKTQSGWEAADVYFSATSAYAVLSVTGDIIIQAMHSSNGAVPPYETTYGHKKYSTVAAQKNLSVIGEPYFHKSIEKLSFSGESKQQVKFKNEFYGNSLQFNNPSEEGVEFISFTPNQCLEIGSVIKTIATGLKCSARLQKDAHLAGDFEFKYLYVYNNAKIEGNLTITNLLSFQRKSDPQYYEFNEEDYSEIEVTKDLILGENARFLIKYPTSLKVGKNLVCNQGAEFDFYPFYSLSGHSSYRTSYMQKLKVLGSIIVDKDVDFRRERLDVKLKGNLISKSPITVNNLELGGSISNESTITANILELTAGMTTGHSEIATPSFNLTTFKHNCVPHKLIPGDLLMIDSDHDGYFDFEDAAPLDKMVTTPVTACPALTTDFDNDGWDDIEELLALGTTNSTPEGDLDNDGLPNNWEIAHHLDPKTDDTNLDFDKDGITNGQEFATGTDPSTANIGANYPNKSDNIIILTEDSTGIIIESGYTVVIPENTQININGDITVDSAASFITHGNVTIAGNITTAGTIEITRNSTTTANGAFTQSEGELKLGGVFVVSKDFSATGDSFFTSTNESAHLNVRGSISVNTANSTTEESSAKCLVEVRKNISVANNSLYFYKDIKELKLSGTEQQFINIVPPFHGTILTLANALDNGITFTNFSSENTLDFSSSKPVSLANTELKLKLVGNDTDINGDVIFKELDMGGHFLSIDGYLTITKSITVNSILNISKNLTLAENAHMTIGQSYTTITQDLITQEGSTITVEDFPGFGFITAQTFNLDSKFTYTGKMLNLIVKKSLVSHNSSPLFFEKIKINNSGNHTITTQGDLHIKELYISLSSTLINQAGKDFLAITAPFITIEKLNHRCAYINFNTPSLHLSDFDSDGVLDILDAFPENNYRSKPEGICPAVTSDFDKDGLIDSYEFAQFGSWHYGANDDPDNDSLTNIAEYQHGTNASLKDSDYDGMPDGWEVTYQLDPLRNDGSDDQDNDGVSNYDEYQNGTDPKVNDSSSQRPNLVPVINLLLLN